MSRWPYPGRAPQRTEPWVQASAGCAARHSDRDVVMASCSPRSRGPSTRGRRGRVRACGPPRARSAAGADEEAGGDRADDETEGVLDTSPTQRAASRPRRHRPLTGLTSRTLLLDRREIALANREPLVRVRTVDRRVFASRETLGRSMNRTRRVFPRVLSVAGNDSLAVLRSAGRRSSPPSAIPGDSS